MQPDRRDPELVRRLEDRRRDFRDRDGRWWRAFEIPQVTTEHGHAPRALIFASDHAIRRVRDYPDNWRELSDADLEALSWRS